MNTKCKKTRRDKINPLARDAYSHTIGQDVQIYPEPRHYGRGDGHHDQIEINWFDESPQNQQNINKEQYAIRELNYTLEEE